MQEKYDVIVAGGGTTGVAAAISASREGCKVLIIEKSSFLGGTATGALVTPMMNNMIQAGENLSGGIISEVLERLAGTGDSATFKDKNPGWFNSEMLKCVLDDFCEENNIEILFDTVLIGAETADGNITSVKCFNKGGISELKAKYYIDATGDADLAAFAGVPFESNEHQSMSLRFIMANINIDTFSQWLADLDPDSSVTAIDYRDYETILLSTAYTSENKGWKLRPFFAAGIREGIIQPEDAEYFQIFSIPGQNNAIAFNCPRIASDEQLDPLNPEDVSYAYKQGRKQIRRLAEFCKRYMPGFEGAYVSQIAPQLGVRDSRRIEGKYKLTETDIFQGKKFENSVAKSNYPVDIHSKKKGGSELTHLAAGTYYEIPLDSLLPNNINNLAVAGRCISTTFKAQASVRIQPNCWSMGEYAGKYVAGKITE